MKHLFKVTLKTKVILLIGIIMSMELMIKNQNREEMVWYTIASIFFVSFGTFLWGWDYRHSQEEMKKIEKKERLLKSKLSKDKLTEISLHFDTIPYYDGIEIDIDEYQNHLMRSTISIYDIRYFAKLDEKGNIEIFVKKPDEALQKIDCFLNLEMINIFIKVFDFK